MARESEKSGEAIERRHHVNDDDYCSGLWMPVGD